MNSNQRKASIESEANRAPARGLICERCNRELDPETAVMLEYDNSLDMFFDPDFGLVPEDCSQGGYWLGPDCAKAASYQTNPERIDEKRNRGGDLTTNEAEILIRWLKKRASDAQTNLATVRRAFLPFGNGIDAVAETLGSIAGDDGRIVITSEDGFALARMLVDIAADATRANRLEEIIAAERREASRESDDYDKIIARMEADAREQVRRIDETSRSRDFFRSLAVEYRKKLTAAEAENKKSATEQKLTVDAIRALRTAVRVLGTSWETGNCYIRASYARELNAAAERGRTLIAEYDSKFPKVAG